MVDQHGIMINRAPTSLAEEVNGHFHVNPEIPTRLP
jgi:hypothetical protein